MADKIKPEAHLSRVQALLSSIEHLCILLEDACGGAREGFYLTTAIEACVEVARGEATAAEGALR